MTSFFIAVCAPVPGGDELMMQTSCLILYVHPNIVVVIQPAGNKQTVLHTQTISQLHKRFSQVLLRCFATEESLFDKRLQRVKV